MKPDLKPIEYAFSKISEGYAYCEIVTDKKGEPIDWIYLEVNDAYEQINGVKRADVVGKKATEVMPSIRTDPGDWIRIYGQVALTGQPIVTERYAAVRKKWYHVSAYCPQTGYFVAIFEDITERKKAEESIKQSEAFFSKAFNESPVATIITRLADGCYIDVNDNFEQIFGYSKNEVIGRTSSELNIFADAGGRKAFLDSLQKKGRLHNIEMTFRSKTGRLVPCLISTEKININECEHLLTTLLDISDRKQAEQALWESEQRWSTTLSSIGDAVIATDTLGKVTFLNPVAEQLTGWTLALAKGKPIKKVFNIVNEQTRNEVENPVTKVLKLGLIVGLANHTVLIRKDGSEVPIDDSGAPIVSEEGKITGVVLVFRDITERKKAEDALQQSLEKEHFLAEIVRTASVAVGVGYPDGHLGLVNNAFEELTGYTSDELHKINWIPALTPPEYAKFEAEKLAELHRTKAPVRYEKEYIKKDCSRVPIELMVTPLVDKQGHVTHYFSFLTDITQRKKAEEALIINNRRTQEIIESIQEYFYSLDRNWNFIYVNEKAANLLGHNVKDLIGKNIWTFFPRGLGTAFEKNYRAVMEHREVRRFETRGAHANVWLMVTVFPSEEGISSLAIDITERKKAEEALKRQAALIDLSPDAIIVRKLDGTITFWSRGAEKLYGWTQQEAIGKRTHTLFETKFPEPYNTIITKLTTEKRWSCELVHKTKDGHEVTVQSWWLTEETAHGEISSILESNVDVTERKKAEEHLQKLNRVLKAISDSNQALMRANDEQSFLQEACRIIAEDCGYKMVWVGLAEDDAAKTVRPVAYAGLDEGYINTLNITWEDTERGRGPTGKAIRTGEPQFCEDMHKDPEFAPWRREALKRGFASSIALPLKSGSKTFGALTMYSKELNVCSVDEIALMRELAGDFAHGIMLLRLRAEKEKGEKEIVRLASFPTLNPTPVLEVGADGRITYANPATKVLFPTLETEGLNHIFFNDWSTVRNTLNDKGVVAFGREVNVNNHWYHQQFYLVPYTHQIRIYATDIDELKQTELARAKAQTKLEENAVQLEEYASQMEELAEQRAQQLQNAERLAAIGATAGMVGHDIRNPLQAITGDMYLISEEIKDLPEGDCKDAVLESIESVNRNLVYINKIVSDLQDYTRPLKPNLQDANLSELVEGTLATITIPKGIEVTTEIKETAKPIKTDAAFMRRILTNLLTNAVQAMQEEGQLTLNASKLHDTIILTIADTGIGIPDEVKAKMFTPLFTTKSKGQGLGLAVVKRLVEALGGSITFESMTGKGTKFIVELPQKQ